MTKLASVISTIALSTSFLACAGLGVAAASNAFDGTIDASAAAVASGSVIIKKDDTSGSWVSRDKIVGYFFNDNQNAWGTAVANNSFMYQEYTWSLNFTPTTVIFLNVADNWSSSWDNPWWSPNCRTGNISLSSIDVVWMKSDANEGGNFGSYSLETYVKGGSSQSWTTPTVNTKLSNIKTDGTKIEVYGQVSLPANTYFKTVKTGVNPQEWCGNYTANDLIKSNLDGGGNDNIHNKAEAKYEFYFNFDGNTTYITDPIAAAADEWAQYFVANVGCDPTGATLPSGWTTVAENYSGIDGDVKDFIYKGTAKSGGTYLENALYQYDWAVSHHSSLTKFVTDKNGHVRAANVVVRGIVATPNDLNPTPFIAIVAVISVSTIGGFIFYKTKRKEH